MIKYNGAKCKIMSDISTDVYIGSGFCKRCRFFNGKVSKSEISCLRPEL